MFFVLNNVVGPALPLWGRGSDGRPIKFLFWEDLTSTGGEPSSKQGHTGANCCECPDDNGDSWTVADAGEAARGAFIFVEVVGKVNMAEVVNRLNACKANQKRVMELAAGGPTHGEGDWDPNNPFAKPDQPLNEDTRPRWQQQGYESKKAWQEAGRP